MVGEMVEIMRVDAGTCQFSVFAKFDNPLEILVETFQVYKHDSNADKLISQHTIPISECVDMVAQVKAEAGRQLNNAVLKKSIWDKIVETLGVKK